MGAQSINGITQTTVKVSDFANLRSGTVDCAIALYNRLIRLPDRKRKRQHHHRQRIDAEA
jgi:hypothetical protein